MSEERKIIKDGITMWETEKKENSYGLAHLADRAIALLKDTLANLSKQEEATDGAETIE